MNPSIGCIVHYVSYGTPGGEHKSECRAAVVTEVAIDATTVGLCVLNPTGQFFNRGVKYHAGAGEPGAADCVHRAFHGNPHRYCACGWTEDHLSGGTWHWPERVG